MDKMEALRRKLTKIGMLAGTTSSYIMAQIKTEENLENNIDNLNSSDTEIMSPVDDEDDDGGPIPGGPTDVMSDIKLAARSRMSCTLLA
jgi:hypothetical protein